MIYHRKTKPAMDARSVERRQERRFRKLLRDHIILRELYSTPEIEKQHALLEDVLWDFYMAGFFDMLKLSAFLTHDVLKRTKNEYSY